MIDPNVRRALTQPMQSALDAFERRTNPSILDMAVGMPNQIEGKTQAALNLKNFANNIKSTVKDIGSTHFRINADNTLTDGLKLTRSATLAKNKINDARKAFKPIAENALAQIDHLNGALQNKLQPPSSPGQAAIDAELRAWVKTHKDNEIHLAARLNKEVLAAVARAPHVLSGLSKDVHDNLKGEYLAAVAPDEYAQHSELMQAIQTANTALGYLETEAESLIDFDTADKFESRRYQG